MRNTLNRKYLMQAIDGSLERLGHDFVDVLYCHRVRPRHADRGDGVGDERHRRRRQGAVLGHERVVGRRDPRRDRDRRAAPPAQAGHRAAAVQPAGRDGSSGSTPGCSTRRGYGATIWSPLASGLLTGKYRDGIPEDSRGALAGYGWLAKRLTDERGARQGRGAAPDRRRARAARWPSSRWRGAPRTPTCRPSSPAPAGRARSSRTSTRSTSSPCSTPTSWPASTRRR